MTDTDDEEPGTKQMRREMVRQRRIVDQMLTAHAALRDKYGRQTTARLASILVGSAVASAFAFASNEKPVTLLGVQAARATWLGLFAVAIFALTLVDLVLDSRGKAGRHREAVKRLATLKAAYRALPQGNVEDTEYRRLSDLYQSALDGLPAIPERHFLRLKARHLRKVERSRIISAYPGATLRQARRILRRRVEHERRKEPGSS